MQNLPASPFPGATMVVCSIGEFWGEYHSHRPTYRTAYFLLLIDMNNPLNNGGSHRGEALDNSCVPPHPPV